MRNLPFKKKYFMGEFAIDLIKRAHFQRRIKRGKFMSIIKPKGKEGNYKNINLQLQTGVKSSDINKSFYPKLKNCKKFQYLTKNL
jgi:hypothetical protein